MATLIIPKSRQEWQGILYPDCRDWVADHGIDPCLCFSSDGIWYLELPDDLAVEFTLRWL